MADKPFGLTVRAIIRNEQGRTLLIRRASTNKHFVGQWEWPGGKVDPGEDFVTALHRELAEETGLTVTLTQFAGAASAEMPKARVVLLFMEAVSTGGFLTLSDEHDAAEWVPLSDFANWTLTEYMRDFMLDYARRAR